MPLSLTHRSRSARRFSPIATLGHLYGVWRQRQALANLDEAALRDIGITRSEAEAEARRALWDAPIGWTR